jgi:hypothetical protein
LHVSGEYYGPLLGYLVLVLLLRAREGVVLGKIVAHFYLHFPQVHNWAVRLFAEPSAFSDPT